MGVNLDAYLERIAYRGPLEPTVTVLKDLHLAHVTHIPFENLDVLLRRPIRLDTDSLWAKLVTGGRGGYCFEHNAVFAAVLEAIGFGVKRLSARVRYGATEVRARTHMLMQVEADGEPWIADVGFGSDGLVHPIPFRPGETVEQFAWKFRVVAEPPNFALQAWRPEGWLDLYCFGLEEHFPIDYEVANYYTSTHPNSGFLRRITAQFAGPERSLTLVGHKLIERTAAGDSETPLADDAALLTTLSDRFGLVFPPETRFPIVE